MEGKKKKRVEGVYNGCLETILLNQITARTLAAFSTSVCVYILHTGPRDEANLALTGTLCNVLKHHADLVDTTAAAVAKTSQNTTEK